MALRNKDGSVDMRSSGASRQVETDKKNFWRYVASLILAIPTILSYWLVTFTLFWMYLLKKPYEEADKLWDNIEKFPDNGEFILFGLILVNIVIQISPKRSDSSIISMIFGLSAVLLMIGFVLLIQLIKWAWIAIFG
jgi:hypothetical protein